MTKKPKKTLKMLNTKNALAGNRTRAARVAGEHSTTEPPVLINLSLNNIDRCDFLYIKFVV
jgi:hypothetical protein